ncbi:hypothetical protein ACLOJK_037526, partial [Asimina triloba]
QRRSTGFGAPSSSSSRQPWLPAMGFPAKHPTANQSRLSRRPHPDPHPTITTDGCPFFHDAKSRWVETHLAVHQQALHPFASRPRAAPASRPRGDSIRPRAGVRPHQPASVHSSLARRQICLHQPFHHGQHDPPTTSADGLKPISTPATIQPDPPRAHKPFAATGQRSIKQLLITSDREQMGETHPIQRPAAPSAGHDPSVASFHRPFRPNFQIGTNRSRTAASHGQHDTSTASTNDVIGGQQREIISSVPARMFRSGPFDPSHGISGNENLKPTGQQRVRWEAEENGNPSDLARHPHLQQSSGSKAADHVRI